MSQAKELIDKFIPNVYCYLGSGMLTNHYDDDVAVLNAKKQATICVEEIIKELRAVEFNHEVEGIPFDYYEGLIQKIKEYKYEL